MTNMTTHRRRGVWLRNSFLAPKELYDPDNEYSPLTRSGSG